MHSIACENGSKIYNGYAGHCLEVYHTDLPLQGGEDKAKGKNTKDKKEDVKEETNEVSSKCPYLTLGFTIPMGWRYTCLLYTMYR